MTESKLWKHDLYLNPNIFYLFNKCITEYDMQEAGFSLIQEFGLLPDKVIKELKTYGKDNRKKKIGIIRRDDKKFSQDLNDAFQAARQLFFEENNLSDENIISIKKDAIITTENCKVTKLGKYVNFRPKHQYTSYIMIKPNKDYHNKEGIYKPLELYYSPYEFDVKGISTENLELHEDYMCKFLKMFFKKMETEEPRIVIEFTRRFIDRYKRKELEVGYYRNFNSKSSMVLIDGDMDNIDIEYNLYNILIKLIKIPL